MPRPRCTPSTSQYYRPAYSYLCATWWINLCVICYAFWTVYWNGRCKEGSVAQFEALISPANCWRAWGNWGKSWPGLQSHILTDDLPNTKYKLYSLGHNVRQFNVIFALYLKYFTCSTFHINGGVCVSHNGQNCCQPHRAGSSGPHPTCELPPT
jgi:hypothetical protein